MLIERRLETLTKKIRQKVLILLALNPSLPGIFLFRIIANKEVTTK